MKESPVPELPLIKFTEKLFSEELLKQYVYSYNTKFK